MTNDVLPQIAHFLDTFRVIEKLRTQHWQRVGLGVVVGAAAVFFNLTTLVSAPLVESTITIPVATVYLLGGAWFARWRIIAGQRAARSLSAAPREQAVRLAEIVSRVGNVWLTWATIGHVLIGLATMSHIQFSFTVEALVLWAALLPTLILLGQGVVWPPTRERVLAYRG